MLYNQAMEQQLWQAEAVTKEQGGELKAVKEKEAELEQQVTALTGQHNIHQRIQHHQKVKDENNALRGQLAACRDDVAKHSIRCRLFPMLLLVLWFYCCLSDGGLCLFEAIVAGLEDSQSACSSHLLPTGQLFYLWQLPLRFACPWLSCHLVDKMAGKSTQRETAMHADSAAWADHARHTDQK